MAKKLVTRTRGTTKKGKKNAVITALELKKRKDKMATSDLVPKACKCGRVVERVKKDAEWVICWECIARACPPPMPKVKVVKKDDGFLTGWRWMKQFVHRDGRVFEKGVENPKLKGKLKPTPPKEKKPRLSKYEKEQKQIEKDKKLAAKYEKKQKVLKKKKAKNLKSSKFFGD